jgi:hypothetical protein
VKHVGARGERDVGAVVDRHERAVAAGRVGEHLERFQLGAGLQRSEPLLADRTLVTQLDDVHPACQRGVDELGQVAAFPAGVGAQVELSFGETCSEI